MSFRDIGFFRLDQPVQLRFLYGFLQEGQQLLAHEKRSGMAYSDILSTIVYVFRERVSSMNTAHLSSFWWEYAVILLAS